MTDVIKINNLSKHYGKTIGVEDLSLTIQKGEIFGFLGQNGAGKTTTIRCILNILLPNSGEIFVNGDLVTRFNPEIKEGIGYLPGELNVPGHYKTSDFIKYIASLRQTPSLRMDELTTLFEVPLNKRFSQLSKGNKQKVGIVLALMSDPAILILDEPTSGLDPIYQQIFYDLILSEKERGKTIFFSSHNLDEVQRICDRVGIIREGKLVSIEIVDGLAKQIPRELHAVLTTIDEDKLKTLGDSVTKMNADTGEIEIFVDNTTHTLADILDLLSTMQIKDLSYPPASLEAYFLAKYREERTVEV